MRTLTENFEGFLKVLKELSGEKRYLGVFTNKPNSNNLWNNDTTATQNHGKDYHHNKHVGEQTRDTLSFMELAFQK